MPLGTPSGRAFSGFFSILLLVWQVERINPQILQIYFPFGLWALRRFPQERLLTNFPQGRVLGFLKGGAGSREARPEG
jgi:hypothetical protein